MSHSIPAFLAALGCVVGLRLVPLGLPGLWVMVLGVIGYGWLMGFQSVGVATIAVVVGLAFLAELVEWWLGFGLARRYGGSRRAGWGALGGGLIGAGVGGPIPRVRSGGGGVVGALWGAAPFPAVPGLNAGGARPGGHRRPPGGAAAAGA